MSVRGPLPRFTDSHLWRALEIIVERRRVGRKELVRELGIGEGSVRTILDRLRRDGLVTSSRKGHEPTKKGKKVIRERSRKFVRIDAGDMTVGEIDVATVVRGAASRVRYGIEQRDEAIKIGADGATVLVFRKGKLQLPGGFARVEEDLSQLLIRTFDLKEGDVVVIGTAKDPARAEEGARAAARSLES